ncbi:MAG TPA: 4-alpha-glucanotransferase [Candidatus Thiothrix moscowensis]|uniref:4-alpha-glucanotransferase n=2 Tax=Thiothrix TaxID=1030 RepID=UPI0025E9E608|nr:MULTISPECIES: 4-alpha-glucanotransferase [unclassified Thiothrix]HRJ54475.1 4-alpha-glucanotransferase [Candidatus Thiothrix moscowensis]HRJ94824.1 4-alpha-glucanotransferase [Candidatus Thiothrix moscowensis]
MTTLQGIGRAAGVLLHPTSLPSGKLDADAFRWLDWLAEAGFRVWQMLPLGVPLVGLSPYQCASAFAVNPGLFAEPLTPSPSPSRGEGSKTSFSLDSLSPSPLEGEGLGVRGKNFDLWYDNQKHWVEDYALFMVLKQQFHGQEWHEWPAAFRSRDPEALFRLRGEQAEALAIIIHEQYTCWQQWQTLRGYAQARGVYLFGDMPIFVAYDSADVWANPQRFLLDATGAPTFVTGVPPDYFSETGQRWGNPHYNWATMQAENFLWWKQRLQYHFEFFDLVRLDHFRGLAASWMIPSTEQTAINGFWQDVPGDAMLASIQADMGKIPLVAEDLGIITPDVTALRNKYGLPGMSVLQFAFDHFEDNPHKPQNVRENTVYYTGTHDNDTLLGWFLNLDEGMQQHVMRILGITEPEQLTDTMLATILASPALLAVIPWQDLLRLGTEARMNIPGTVEGNWQWRFAWNDVPAGLASQLHNKLQGHQRNERASEPDTTR